MASEVFKRNRPCTIKMIILGIETSCDETAAAIVKDGKFAVSSAVNTSIFEHVKTGGIIPEIAARKQIEYMIPVVEHVLKDASLTPENLDAIAVTYGPGLIGSLLVGVETAKTLSLVWNKPIVPVNHLIGHVYANWIDNPNPPEFPAVCFVVSGGHTDLVLMKDHGQVNRLGGTRDDAAGEAFDKTARILGLGYPGGPAIAEAAKDVHPPFNLFPRPMIDSGDLDTSFSGLKTAVDNYIKKNPDFDKNLIAAEIQEAIVDTLVAKSLAAVTLYEPKSFILAGGVSANLRLREKIANSLSALTKVFIPEPKYTTDNATMIATAAFYNFNPIPWQDIAANPSLTIEEKF